MKKWKNFLCWILGHKLPNAKRREFGDLVYCKRNMLHGPFMLRKVVGSDGYGCWLDKAWGSVGDSTKILGD